jgi:predicted nucleic acid-binding protein
MSKPEYRTLRKFLQAALQGKVIPIFYFDTNVILDIMDSREQSSVTLFEFLVEKEWVLVTSTFAKVEIYESKQIDEFRSQKEKQGWAKLKIDRKLHDRHLTPAILNCVSQSVINKLDPIIKHFLPDTRILQEGWAIAEDIKQSTNLTDKDSIHLAEARAAACDILLTNDRPLIKVAKDYIWAERPAEIARVLGITNRLQ